MDLRFSMVIEAERQAHVVNPISIELQKKVPKESWTKKLSWLLPLVSVRVARIA